MSGTPPCGKSRASTVQIRDQGQCGDCWAFATAEEIRSAYTVQHGEDPGKLSTQFLVDCWKRGTTAHGANGCSGGHAGIAMNYVSVMGGIPTAEDYGEIY